MVHVMIDCLPNHNRIFEEHHIYQAFRKRTFRKGLGPKQTAKTPFRCCRIVLGAEQHYWHNIWA